MKSKIQFKNIQSLSEEGSEACENQDYIATAKNYAIILDGATGLLPGGLIEGHDYVAWFVATFFKYLKPLLKEEKTLPELIKLALIKTNKKYRSVAKNIHPDIYPSAAICATRMQGDKLEIFILGDCQLAIKFSDGKVKHFQVNDIKRMDAVNIDKMQKFAREQGIDIVEARKLINDDLVATRRLMNTKKGYYILSDDAAAVDKGFYCELPLDNVDSILGFSDGFSQLVDTFKVFKIKDIFSQIENGKTLLDLNAQLKALQEQDALCNNYPRFKKRDDTSVFYAKIKE